MWATRILFLALIIAIGIAFQGIACGQSPGFTDITTDTAWIGPDSGVSISYTLTDATCCDVYLGVYNSDGGEVRTIHAGMQGSGTYSIEWDGCYDDGTHVPEGTYTLHVYAIDYAVLPDQLTAQWKWLLDPYAISIDESGNVYVIDFYSLRKFAPDGSDATLVQWNDPLVGMAVDMSGNVYALDNTTDTVYVIHPDGTAAPLATGLEDVSAMAVDAAGNLYVASTADLMVRKISPDGTVAVIGICPLMLTAMTADPAGNVYMVALEGDLTVIRPDGTTGTLYRGLVGTSGLAVDASGNIYVSTLLDHSVKKITSDMRLVTLNDGFEHPSGLAVDASGNLYVIDQGKPLSVPQVKYIYVVHPDGAVTRMGPGFSHPSHLAVHYPGTFYISDFEGQIKRVAGDDTTTVLGTRFYQPNIAVDADGTIYISDKFQSDIMALSPDGTLVSLGSGFRFPSGIAVDAEGNVYVADTFNGAVKVIFPNGTISTLASGFEDPWDVAVDSLGNVYVTDGIIDGTITKISPDGTMDVLASGYEYPDSIAVDTAGIVYFTDNENTAVQAIYPDGTIVQLGAFQLLIYDLAVDTSGNLYVDCIEGIYMLSRPAFAGNAQTVSVDLTAPVTTCQLSGPIASGPAAGGALVTLSATDGGSGVSSIEYSLDNGAWNVYAEPFSVTEAGKHKVEYRSEDNAGNLEAVKSTPFGVGPLEADFSTDVTSGDAPLTVHFYDQSSGYPVSWVWDLDGGVHSWSTNPAYTFNTPGTYTISLTVSNGYASDTITKTEHITVNRASNSFTIPLKQGWNLVSIPLQTDSVTASSLGALGVTEVAWYDASAGSYGIYLVGLSPDDFSLRTDLGYFLYCSRDSSLTVTGFPPSGWTETLQTGWNLAGWGTLSTSDARAVAASIPGTQEIARYNAANGRFDVYLEGRTPAAFTMKPGEGYFIYTSAAGTLDYDSLGGD